MEYFAQMEIFKLKKTEVSKFIDDSYHPYSDQFELEAQSATTSEAHASNAMTSHIENSSTKTMAVDQGFSPDANLDEFLSRRVQIASLFWSVGSPLSASISPWELFLTNPAVERKINNYALVKGDLKITMLINGTPFHAGMALASYAYMAETNELVTIGGDTQLITYSQRPHIYLNASTCKGGCICVPFFWPYNYFNISNGDHSPAEIGTLRISSMADLVQINGGTDSVNIAIFAHMENVKLTAPTTTLSAMSSPSNIDFSEFFVLESQADEYPDNGVISGPASAVASYAGILAQIPYIKPFALATQIGASAVGSIARLFGYSKPAIISDITPMRSYPVSSLALTEGGDTSQKLTVTAKQELSIDPTISGLLSEDTLTIKHMAMRESYVEQFSWSPAQVAGDYIFSGEVNPMCERRTSGTSPKTIVPTSLSFATRPFGSWCGTLRYRFQVIASQYHRGRLAVIYDPVGPLSGDPYNTTFNVIIDLADGRDFTIDFPWQQDRPYAAVDTNENSSFFLVPPLTPQNKVGTQYDNGCFYIRVVNELVVPDATTPVTILVSVCACEDFEVANPTGAIDQFTYYAQSSVSSIDFGDYFTIVPQSAVEEVPLEENSPEAELNIMTMVPNTVEMIDQKPLIFFGERILSFRQLLKRYTYNRIFSNSGVGTNQVTYTLGIRAIPFDPGFDPNGPDTSASAIKMTYAGVSYFSYLKRAYAGWRGSIRWKVAPITDSAITSVTRNTGEIANNATVNGVPFSYQRDISTVSRDVLAWTYYAYGRGLGSGAALTLNRTQDGLEFEVPMAVPFRFCKTSLYPWSTNSYNSFSPGGDTIKIVSTTGSGNQLAFQTYCATGEDISFLGWIGAPVTYYRSSLPSA